MIGYTRKYKTLFNRWKGLSAVNKDILLDAIEAKRTELLNVAFENGLTSPLAIEYRQELDRLLNLYDELHIRDAKKRCAK